MKEKTKAIIGEWKENINIVSLKNKNEHINLSSHSDISNYSLKLCITTILNLLKRKHLQNNEKCLVFNVKDFFHYSSFSYDSMPHSGCIEVNPNSKNMLQFLLKITSDDGLLYN